MRAFIAGLVALCSIACADGPPTATPRPRTLALDADGGVDAGPEPVPCDWSVYWLTRINREEPCNWGMRSNDPSIALFRTQGGECLAPASICGIAACADITYVREKQIIEVWGPPGLDAGTVWAATESFSCEGEL